MMQYLINLRNYLPRPMVAALALVVIVVINVAATVVVMVPPLRRLVVNRMKSKKKKTDDKAEPEIVLRSIPGFTTMRTMKRALFGRIYDDLRLGQAALDVTVISLDGKEHKLLDFMKPGRPLVLRFGSCS